MPFKPHFSWDFLSPKEINGRSLRALQNHIDYLKRDSRYYQEVLQNISSADIQSLQDIDKLPFTDKDTLSTYGSLFQVAAPDDIVETVITNGKNANPLLFPLTPSDLDRLAYNESLSFHGAGVSAADRAQILTTMDNMHTSGMSYYRGLTALGVNCFRIGHVSPQLQQNYIELMQPTILIGTPTYLLQIGEQMRKSGMKLADCSVQKIFAMGEPIRHNDHQFTAVANRIQEIYGASIYSTYSATALSSTFCDCSDQQGGHSHPELVYVEIVDEQGNPVPDGTIGELVATPFGVAGMPLLRYRTGDKTFKISEKCSCGRNSIRLGPVSSGKAIAINFQSSPLDTNVITTIIDAITEVKDYIIELKGREGSSSEEIFIHAATKPANGPIIMARIQAATKVLIPVLISNTPTINGIRGDSGEKNRFIDNRKKS